MIKKGRKKGTIRFSYRPGEKPVEKVCVAGDFNDWTPRTMRRQKSGEYVAICPVTAEADEYKFIVDDQWQADPDNESIAINDFGTANSVARLDG